MKVNYPVARNHPILHAAPTFRPIRRGRRKQGLLRKYKTEQGELTIEMFYELDIADQDLMLAIFAIARAEVRGKIIEIEDNHNDDNKDLLNGLELNLTGTDDIPVHNMPTLKIKTTKYELLKEIGRSDNDASYKWLKSSLNRISKIGFFYDGKKWCGSFHMMAFKGLHGSGEFQIIINPISSQSIYSDKHGYINIHREERHTFKNDYDKALHSALCGLVSLGTTRILSIDVLAKRVYADYDDEITNNTIKIRRGKMKKSSININNLDNWNITIYGKGKNMMTKITRKSFKY